MSVKKTTKRKKSAMNGFFRATIMTIALLILLGFNSNNLMAQNTDPCLDSVKVYEHINLEECCIEITITNPDCELLAVKFELIPANIYAEGVRLSIRQEHTFKVCLKPGNGVTGWKIYGGNSYGNVYFSNSIELKDCCPCSSDWITFETIEADDCPDGCWVRPIISIPENAECYREAWISVEGGIPARLLNFPNGFLGKNIQYGEYCIDEDESLEIVLYLFKDRLGITPTIENLEAMADCIVRPEPATCADPIKPCMRDCFDDDYIIPSPFTIWLPAGEFTCQFTVTFGYRFACERFQDLQIISIEYDENGPCGLLPIDTIYKYAVGTLIANSSWLMNFQPHAINDCFTQWRVANAGCWSGRIIGYYDVVDEYGNFVPKYRWTPCKFPGTPCCYQSLTVCKRPGGAVDIYNMNDYIPDVFCEDNGVPNQDIPCRPACAWAGAVNGNFRPTNSSHPKIMYNSLEFGFDINTNFADNLLKINIDAKTAATATVEIFTTNGTRIATETFNLSKGSNVYNYGTSKYTSGAYIYNITIDNKLVFNGRFIVVR